MKPLLTIAIPTFNRASHLDRQMNWLVQALHGYEHLCEIIISDNCSGDQTPAVVRRWQDRLGNLLRTFRNAENTGPLGNISQCIDLARGSHVWVIGDDDLIDDATPAFILELLQQQGNLAAILMNFSSTGKTVIDRCYPFEADAAVDGKDLVETCLTSHYFGLAFMTALVYQTQLARQAIAAWPKGTSNYDYQIFVTAYCARHGQVFVTRNVHVNYVTGDNVYETDTRANLRLNGDTSQVMVRLIRLGYSRKVCAALVRRHLRRFGPKFWLRAWKKPYLVPSILLRYGLSLIQVHLRPFHRWQTSPGYDRLGGYSMR